MKESMIFVNEDNMHHLIRGVRERMSSYNERLNKGQEHMLDPVSVGVTLGNNEALRLLGIIACHEYTTVDLQKWLYSGRAYKGVEHSAVS